jgi:hypothetical protein
LALPACVERDEAHVGVAEPGAGRVSTAVVPGRHVEERREEAARRRQASLAGAGIRSSALRYQSIWMPKRSATRKERTVSASASRSALKNPTPYAAMTVATQMAA